MDDAAHSEDVGNGVGDTVGQVKEAAVSALGAAKQDATSLAASAKDKAKDQIEQSRQAASHTLTDFAGAIRKAGDELAQHDQSLAGRLVKQAADSLESLSNAVANKRPDELLTSARDFGRTNPAAFVAGSVLLGLALGRFAKSSASHGSASETQRNFGSSPTLASQPLEIGSGVALGPLLGTGETDTVEYGILPDESTGGGLGMATVVPNGSGI